MKIRHKLNGGTAEVNETLGKKLLEGGEWVSAEKPAPKPVEKPVHKPRHKG
jgi:hypothetical protein